MPKKTDTRSKVFQAADHLLKTGIRPTQQNVRAEIGTGSISTINSALNDWWRTLAQRMERRDQHPELPEPVLQAATRLWDQSLAYAEHALSQERQALVELKRTLEEQQQGKQAGLQQAVDQLAAQNRDLRQHTDQLQARIQTLGETVLEYEMRLIKLGAERDELQRQVKQLERMQTMPTSSDYPAATHQDQDALFAAKVEAKVNLTKLTELEQALQTKNVECQELQTRLLDQERAAMQQQHRLEMVIAQQDARYEQAVSALKDCKSALSLAQSQR